MSCTTCFERTVSRRAWGGGFAARLTARRSPLVAASWRRAPPATLGLACAVFPVPFPRRPAADEAGAVGAARPLTGSPLPRWPAPAAVAASPPAGRDRVECRGRARAPLQTRRLSALAPRLPACVPLLAPLRAALLPPGPAARLLAARPLRRRLASRAANIAGTCLALLLLLYLLTGQPGMSHVAGLTRPRANQKTIDAAR